MPVTSVGKGSTFVLENKRRRLGIGHAGKRSQDVFKWPVVHIKHNNTHVAISGVLGEPVEGR